MPDLILASASKARQTLLHQAGVKFRTQVSQLDEASFKASLKAEDATAQMAAEALGELKARKVAQQIPESLVIGADQILSINDIWFDKPVDLEHARAHLAALSGKTHFLHTSVSVLRGEQVLWHHNETCEMTMRDLSADFIDAYLAQEGEEVLHEPVRGVADVGAALRSRRRVDERHVPEASDLRGEGYRKLPPGCRARSHLGLVHAVHREVFLKGIRL